ncbi:MAG: hypothetical protein ABI360_09400, partial [Allobranchiibius sp.]
WNAFPADEVAPAHDERMAIFAHIGADDKHGRRYLDYLKTRTYIVNAWRRRPFTPEMVEDLGAVGFVVRDMPAEVKDDKRAGLSQLWAPFWYMGKAEPVAATPVTPAAPAPTTPQPAAAPARPAPSQAFTKRYGRAVKRRAGGIVAGAKQGWNDAAPKAKKAARAGR